MPSGVDEVRRINLVRAIVALYGGARGNQVAASKRLGWDPALLSQYVNKHKKIGAKQARYIEKKFGLPVHSLDAELHGLSAETIAAAQVLENLSREDRDRAVDYINRLKK